MALLRRALVVVVFRLPLALLPLTRILSSSRRHYAISLRTCAREETCFRIQTRKVSTLRQCLRRAVVYSTENIQKKRISQKGASVETLRTKLLALLRTYCKVQFSRLLFLSLSLDIRNKCFIFVLSENFMFDREYSSYLRVMGHVVGRTPVNDREMILNQGSLRIENRSGA